MAATSSDAVHNDAVHKALDALTDKYQDDTRRLDALAEQLHRAEETIRAQAREVGGLADRNLRLRTRVDAYHSGLCRIADMTALAISDDPQRVQGIARGLVR